MLLTILVNNNLTTFQGRAPAQAPRWAAPFLAAAIAPNLLCGPLGHPPFNNVDATPPAAVVYPVTLRTWTQQSLALLSRVPFNNNVFDLPTIAKWTRPGDAPNLLQTLLAVSAPFSSADSSLPIQWKTQDRAALSFGSVAYTTEPFQARAPMEAPQFPAKNWTIYNWSQDALIALAPTTAPFVNHDWPLPTQPVRLEQTWTQTLFESTLAPIFAIRAGMAAPQFSARWFQPADIPNLLLPTSAVGPIVIPAVEQPAGRKIRNIYRVTVDGHKFEFRTLADALLFLERAKEVAADRAREIARVATETQRHTSIPVVIPTLEPPRITVSTRALRGAANATRRDIRDIYEKALVDTEIAILMELLKRGQDDEDAMMLLM